MHEKIEKLLRYCAKTNCAECAVAGCPGPQAFLAAAANEIEKLRRHYCPHAIRNVNDRGDDSLCRVLGAEPPKEET